MNIAVAKGRTENNFIYQIKDKNIIKYNKFKERELKRDISNDYSLLLVKSNDVISLVANGYADLGIVGSDIIEEKQNSLIKEIYNFEDNKCYFAMCSLPNTQLEDIKVVASKYPNVARYYLNCLGLNCEIRQMEGSLEIAPKIGYADAIIDIVESGNTIRDNGLVILTKFDYISTRIICRNETPDVISFVRKLK